MFFLHIRCFFSGLDVVLAFAAATWLSSSSCRCNHSRVGFTTTTRGAEDAAIAIFTSVKNYHCISCIDSSSRHTSDLDTKTRTIVLHKGAANFYPFLRQPQFSRNLKNSSNCNIHKIINNQVNLPSYFYITHFDIQCQSKFVKLK